MSSNSQAFKIRRNITVGDPNAGGPLRLPTVTCPGTTFVTRIDIRTRFNTDNSTQPIRYQWIKGLRVYCSGNDDRGAMMPQGTLNWDGGVVDEEANGPVVASGVRDVVAATGAVIDHFGYGTFMRGNLGASWRQADAKDVRECVLAEVGATGGSWLFSLNLGFLCPGAPGTTITTTTTTGAPTATSWSQLVPSVASTAAVDSSTGAGLGDGALVGIVLGIGIVLAAVAALIVRQRQRKRKRRAPTQAIALMDMDQDPPPLPDHQAGVAGAAGHSHVQHGQGHADAGALRDFGDIIVIGAHKDMQYHVQFQARTHTHQQQPLQVQRTSQARSVWLESRGSMS